ncbi:MAG: hypothetical protein ACOCVF_01400 [bacterium]
MDFIIALPNTKYYLWQILVQINNFKKFNYDDNLTYVIGYVEDGLPYEEIEKIVELTGVKFYFYKDKRKSKKYPSSLRPNILKQHFERYPYKYKTFLYLDPDVIFTSKINFGIYDRNDSWYASDTTSYINSKYIKSKSEELFNKMCKIVDIDKSLVEENDKNAGGAQYIMKNVDYKFWEKVEKDSEDLYHLMISTEKKYKPNHPIQSWTADMWAVLWNAWYFNNDVKVVKGLDFAWATDNIKEADNKSILHMAGMFSDPKAFNKINYSGDKTPFMVNINKDDNKEYVVYKYIEEIEDTMINYQHLLF